MKRGLLAFLAVFALGSGISASPASAATQVIVTPSNQQGWSSGAPYAETRDGGAVSFVADPTAPGSPDRGALELTTPLLPLSAKAQYMHAAATSLSSVTELSYYTKQISATFPQGDPSYQLQVCLNGATATPCGFTTLVFEPYQNPAQQLVVNNVWQQWDVDAGLFWSTRVVTCSNGTILGTPGGPATYTLAQVNSICPNATAIAFGVDIGSNNPAYVVRTDLVNFNGTTYNFELDATCREKDNNKDGNKDKSNNKDGNKLPKCDKDDSGDNDNSGDDQNSD